MSIPFQDMPLVEGKWEGDVFLPVYHPLVYRDMTCQWYRGSYLQAQMGISQATIFSFLQEGKWEGSRIRGDYEVLRTSVLEDLSANHFMQRTSIEEPVASLGEGLFFDAEKTLRDYPLTLAKTPMRMVPALWSVDQLLHYLMPMLSAWCIEKDSMRRTIIRYAVEKGAFSFFRVGANFRFSREDWFASLLKIVQDMEKETVSSRGRPQQALYYLISPYLAVLAHEGMVSSSLIEKKLEELHWKKLLHSSEKSAKMMEIGQMSESLASIALQFLRGDDPQKASMVATMRKDLFRE